MADNKEKTNNKNQEPWWRSAVFMFVRLSGWIAIPVIIGAFVGKWLDKRYYTEPWLFLASVGVAFLVSMVGLVRSAMGEFKKIEKGNQNLKIKNQKHKNY